MQVETFEIDEVACESHPEAQSEVLSLIDAMELEGQRELLTPKATGTVRSPYREMTADEAFAYTILCPNKTKAQSYSASPIPLRVLQVLSHALDLGYFHSVQVWDRDSVMTKDPVLVGCVGKNDYSITKICLLARWGEELEAFPILLEKAIAKKREAIKSELRAIQTRVSIALETVDSRSAADLIRHNPNPQFFGD